MLVKRKIKHFSDACKFLVVPSLIFSTVQYGISPLNVYAEDSVNAIEDSNLFKIDCSNKDVISAQLKDNKIILKRSNSETEIWTYELETKASLHFKKVVPIDDLGFIIINNYCDNNHLSQETNLDNKNDNCKEIPMYNLVAFSSDGRMLIDEDMEDISKEYFDKFVEDVFMIGLTSFENNLNELSQEELYNKSLDLLVAAEKTLNSDDIDKAYLAISKIADTETKELLMKRLNVISNQSIDIEINKPTNEEEKPINDVDSISTSSEITLSVDTNSITFDYLNVSQDTTIHKAITLNITSTLAYDVNMRLEGDIVSNTNIRNLDNSVFSVKESSSSNFLTFGDSGVVTVISNSPAGVAKSHGIDIRLNTSTNIIRDVYKAVFKIEAITR